MNNEHRTNYLSREHFFKPIFHRLVLTFHVIHQFSNSFESFPPSVFKLYHGTFFNFSFVIAVLSHLIFSWDWVINDFFFSLHFSTLILRAVPVTNYPLLLASTIDRFTSLIEGPCLEKLVLCFTSTLITLFLKFNAWSFSPVTG